MKAALLAFLTLGWATPALALSSPGPAPLALGRPLDAQTKRPQLLGETTVKEILASRASIRANLAQVRLLADLRARWQAVRRPLTLVAVFGSWCGDSHRQLPYLLALEAEPNPLIEVHYIGVPKSKAVAAWPKGCAPQPVRRVPTFYLFATRPGGRRKLAGRVVETPPRAGQTMAAALVELVEAAAASAGD